MKTRTKTIEIEEAYAELTRDQLVALRTAMRGGNATQDNVQLMNHAAGLLVGHREIANALRDRAIFIESAIKQIDDLIWPPKAAVPQKAPTHRDFSNAEASQTVDVNPRSPDSRKG